MNYTFNSFKDITDEISNNRSYIGMIIYSTKLSTQALVISVYGGTTWISHSGYMLRGATSGVTANSASKTGGNDNLIVPYHNHAFTGSSVNTNDTGAHTHYYSSNKPNIYAPVSAATEHGWLQGGSNYGTGPHAFGGLGQSVESAGSHKHTVTAAGTISYAGTSGNTTNANIPNYKSVYIWERTA